MEVMANVMARPRQPLGEAGCLAAANLAGLLGSAHVVSLP